MNSQHPVSQTRRTLAVAMMITTAAVSMAGCTGGSSSTTPTTAATTPATMTAGTATAPATPTSTAAASTPTTAAATTSVTATAATPDRAVDPVAARYGAWAEGRVVHTSKGDITLPATLDPGMFSELANGFIVVFRGDDAVILNYAGTEVGRAPLSTWVVSHDRTQVAMVSSSTVRVLDQTGRLVTRTQLPQQALNLPLTYQNGDVLYFSTPKGALSWNWRTGATAALPYAVEDIGADGTTAIGIHATSGAERTMCLTTATIGAATATSSVCKDTGDMFYARTLMADGTVFGSPYSDGPGTTPYAFGNARTATVTVGGYAKNSTLNGWTAAPTRDRTAILLSAASGADGAVNASLNTLKVCMSNGACQVVAPTKPAPTSEEGHAPVYVVGS